MGIASLPQQVFKVGAENACRRFLDSAAAPGVLDNCMLLDGINGPLTLSKTKWPEAIWDMNVQGSQWAALAMNSMEQVCDTARTMIRFLFCFPSAVMPERPRAVLNGNV